MFSYDPNQTTLKDRVRFILQDTKQETSIFSDEEIEALLKTYNNNIDKVVIDLALAAASHFASYPDKEQIGPYGVSYASLYERYIRIADIYRQKISRRLNMIDTGSSINTKAFSRDMMKNRFSGMTPGGAEP